MPTIIAHNTNWQFSYTAFLQTHVESLCIAVRASLSESVDRLHYLKMIAASCVFLLRHSAEPIIKYKGSQNRNFVEDLEIDVVTDIF